jgi:hypothetical protein
MLVSEGHLVILEASGAGVDELAELLERVEGADYVTWHPAECYART